MKDKKLRKFVGYSEGLCYYTLERRLQVAEATINALLLELKYRKTVTDLSCGCCIEVELER